jgi:dihydroorotate dehydrogenase (fumarate)
VVLPSIFQEQIEMEAEHMERMLGAGSDSFPEALSYFLPSQDYRINSDHYLDTVRRARAAVDIPVIASLNGASEAGWIDYAINLQDAGASAIELNLYVLPSDINRSGEGVERACLAILRAVRSVVTIPIAVKIGPYFSSPGNMACKLALAGADGLVLFNRFYQPDIDLGTLRLNRDLQLSTASEIRLPLLWIGVLAGKVDASLAATTGVETATEIVKYLLVGADVVMTTSALLRHGVNHMRVLHEGLGSWLAARGVSIGDIRGRMSQSRIKDPSAFERANYIRILQGWNG